jgi:hypothetical protein
VVSIIEVDLDLLDPGLILEFEPCFRNLLKISADRANRGPACV